MNNRAPRLVLICCEGGTEKKYFDIVVKARHISRAIVPPAKAFNQQHRQLIDRCVKERNKISQSRDIPEDEIEVWAVFDKDHWRNGFTELDQYAAEKHVRLAYSDPQFETYLLQHFSADASRVSGEALETRLSEIMENAGYGEYEKGNLKWLETLLDERPRTLENAITNSRVRRRRNQSPFLTVQLLTERLLEFEPK